MFGATPGDERFKGKLNQYVVTKLHGVRRSYWVLHLRGEDPISILIMELVKLKTSADDQLALVSDIKEHKTLTDRQWQAADGSLIDVFAWGTKDKKIDIHREVEKWPLTSKVLGYENEEPNDGAAE